MSHVFSLKNDAIEGTVLVEAANRARAVRYLAAHTTAELIEGGELAKAMQGGAKFFDATQEADGAEPPGAGAGVPFGDGTTPHAPDGFVPGVQQNGGALGV